MTTYGHFTLKGYEERKGNPYFQHGSQWYRITDTHVIQGLDRVNYQAEEVDHREPQRWLEMQAAKAAVAAEEEDRARAREAELDVKRAEYATQHATHRGPLLPDWARTQGWTGRGAISKAIRRRYAEEFGLGHVPGQETPLNHPVPTDIELTEEPGKGWVAHAPEIRASASGETEEEAKANLESLLRRYPEAADE